MNAKQTTSQNKSFFEKYIYDRDKRLLGSTLAIVSGLAGIASPSLKEVGWAMILGALAYKSAKKRQLGLTAPSLAKTVLELIALLAIFFIVFLRNDIRTLIVNDPFPNLTVPVWALTAYVVVVCDKVFSGTRKRTLALIIVLFILLHIVVFYGVLVFANNAPLTSAASPSPSINAAPLSNDLVSYVAEVNQTGGIGSHAYAANVARNKSYDKDSWLSPVEKFVNITFKGPGDLSPFGSEPDWARSGYSMWVGCKDGYVITDAQSPTTNPLDTYFMGVPRMGVGIEILETPN